VKRGLTVAAGFLAFLVFLVALVPANQLAQRLPPAIALSGTSGTIWSGAARSIAFDGHALGALDWSCRPWRLLLLEWSCRVTLSPPSGAVSGDLSGNFGGRVVGREIRGSLPISAFEGIATPPGWTGNLEIDVAELRLQGRRPTAANGTLHLRSLRAPGAQGQQLGDFELVVGEGSVGSDALSGRLRDLGGPLHVRGAIELNPDGSYLLSGDAAPGPGAGPAIFDTLSFLGPPDSRGRRPFAIEGTL
jgi:general secretion pathway protein N